MIYKQLSEEMREGLKNIYQRLSSVAADTGHGSQTPDALFEEASTQLDEVVKATETAAMNIMGIVEGQFELAGDSKKYLDALATKLPDDENVKKLLEINTRLTQDLNDVLIALSFQDITGQRIKKALNALEAIKRSVVELYLSTGLMLEAAEKDPDRDASELQAEAQKAVADYKAAKPVASTLKGPDKNAPSQGAIDEMLAQLGL